MVACKTYKSFGLMADDENGMRNACGNFGGLKSCLLTVTLGCWVTSTSESSSLASGVIADGGFCTVTVPLTAVAADAGAPAEVVAAAEGLPADSLEPPQPASSRGATSNDATTSFRMGGIPRDGIGAHRVRRAAQGHAWTRARTFILPRAVARRKTSCWRRSPGVGTCRHDVRFQSSRAPRSKREMNLTQSTFRDAFASVATLLICR